MGSNQYPNLQDDFLMGVLDQTFPTRNLLYPALFPTEPTFSEVAEWDVKFGGTELASFVAKDSPAHVYKPENSKTMLAKLCYCREKQVVPESVLTNLRPLGVAVNDPANWSKGAIADQKLTSMVQRLNRSVDLLVEWTCMQALQGALTYNRHKVKIDIDYGFKASHKFSVSVAWTDFENATIMKNFDDIQEMAVDEGSPPITDAIMTTRTFNLIKHNDAIRQLLKYERGVDIVETGFLTKVSDVNLIKYDVTYQGDDGITAKMLADYTVIFLARTGPTGDSVGILIEGPAKANNGTPGRFSKSWDTPDPDDTWILVGYYFVPAILYPDWIWVVNVNSA